MEMFTSKMPSIGGAIDVMVVRQPDGTFKSSPFHVRFPAWLFRPRHREVYVEVNGVRTPVVMALGRTGNAYFVERATDIDPNETAVDEDDAASLTGEGPLFAPARIPSHPSTRLAGALHGSLARPGAVCREARRPHPQG